MGLYGKKYHWFVIGYYTPGWYDKGTVEDNFGCNSSRIREAAEGYMTVTWSMNGRVDTTTVSGQVISVPDKAFKTIDVLCFVSNLLLELFSVTTCQPLSINSSIINLIDFDFIPNVFISVHRQWISSVLTGKQNSYPIPFT